MDLRQLGLQLLGLAGNTQTSPPTDAPPSDGPKAPQTLRVIDQNGNVLHTIEQEKEPPPPPEPTKPQPPVLTEAQKAGLEALGIKFPQQSPSVASPPVNITINGSSGPPSVTQAAMSMDDIKKMSVADINKNWDKVKEALESQSVS